MIVMVCVDDKNGMMFNKRRQSQDRVLRQHMLELAGDKDPAQYKEQIEELILFHWNRTYPADLCCTLDLSEWKQKTTEEFAGSSHEKITQEWYVKG